MFISIKLPGVMFTCSATNQKPAAFLQLIEQCKKGHSKSQKRIYNMFYGKMLSLCRRYAAFEAEARQLLQAGFLEVLQNPDRLRQGRAESIVRDIFIEIILRHYVSQGFSVSPAPATEVARLVPQQLSPPTPSSHESMLEALRSLPPLERLVYNLHIIDELPLSFISRHTQLDSPAIERLLQRARHHLGNFWGETGGDSAAG
ncbi:MAG: sigma-70 family RNA polymerase sigma factor [Microscillaceae bacterium]|nr:sigma-70 family RNA polymerase sigma factor [Microscillaceae bacterium]